MIGDPATSPGKTWPKVTFNVYETGTSPLNEGVKVILNHLDTLYPGESSIEHFPLKRVFYNLKHNPNHCAFAITPHDDYLSLRPVVRVIYRIYRLSSSKRFEERDQDSVIATINTIPHEQYVKQFTQSPVIINDRQNILEILNKRRVDYILELETVVNALLSDVKDTEIVEDIEVAEALLYFACSKNTEQRVINWFTNLWDEGRENKSIDKIYESRGYLSILP